MTNQISLIHLDRPPVDKTSGRPPLLILVHGYGSHEQDLFGLAPYLDARFQVVSVRAQLTLGSGSYAWYPLTFTPTGIDYSPDEARAGRLALEQAIGGIVDAFEVDPAAVYLMGFSQGAILSLAIALMHPEMVAGAVVMSGRLLPEAADNVSTGDRLKGLPIIVTHGKWDEVIPVSFGHEIRDFVASQPVDSTYHEYPMGHQITEECLLDITNWLTERLDQ